MGFRSGTAENNGKNERLTTGIELSMYYLNNEKNEDEPCK
jgi:hypothetical protein